MQLVAHLPLRFPFGLFIARKDWQGHKRQVGAIDCSGAAIGMDSNGILLAADGVALPVRALVRACILPLPGDGGGREYTKFSHRRAAAPLPPGAARASPATQ